MISLANFALRTKSYILSQILGAYVACLIVYLQWRTNILVRGSPIVIFYPGNGHLILVLYSFSLCMRVQLGRRRRIGCSRTARCNSVHAEWACGDHRSVYSPRREPRSRLRKRVLRCKSNHSNPTTPRNSSIASSYQGFLPRPGNLGMHRPVKLLLPTFHGALLDRPRLRYRHLGIRAERARGELCA